MWLASGEMVFRGSETIGENVGSASKLARKGKLRNIFIGNASRLLRALGKDSAVITILLCLLAGLHLWQEASTSLLAHEHMRFEGTRGESNDVVALGNEGHAIRGPPSYLPLAQHLKNINQTRKKTSLQDMVYGAQKRTLSDLKPTDNRDLFGCEECTANSKLISRSKIESKKYLNVAQVIMKVITFYNISSMLTLPCAEEIHWVLPLVKTLRVSIGCFRLGD